MIEGRELDRLLCEAVERLSVSAATLMPQREPDGTRRVERYFHHRIVVPALSAELKKHGDSVQPASRTMAISGFRHEGREPGPIDVVIDTHEGPAGIELKWCWEGETFANCVWDVLKLAAAQREGNVHRAYLLVGGASAAFDEGRCESEPLRSALWAVDAVGLLTLDELQGWWRKAVCPRPREIPSAIATRLLSSASHTAKGPGITVALARVETGTLGSVQVDGNGEVIQQTSLSRIRRVRPGSPLQPLEEGPLSTDEAEERVAEQGDEAVEAMALGNADRRYNVFVLGRHRRDEVQLTRYLTALWRFEPQGIGRALAALGLEDAGEIDTWHVRAEVVVPEGRLDLLLEAPGRARVAIEAKVDSSEGPQQLDRYCTWLRRVGRTGERLHLVYLTDGGEPLPPSVEAGCAQHALTARAARWRDLAVALVEREDEETLAAQFVAMLSEEGLAVDPPLNPGDWNAWNTTSRTLSRLSVIVEHAAASIAASMSAAVTSSVTTDRRTVRHGHHTDERGPARLLGQSLQQAS